MGRTRSIIWISNDDREPQPPAPPTPWIVSSGRRWQDIAGAVVLVAVFLTIGVALILGL